MGQSPMDPLEEHLLFSGLVVQEPLNERLVPNRNQEPSSLVVLPATVGFHATPLHQASLLEQLGSWPQHHSAQCHLCSRLASCHGAGGHGHGTTTPPQQPHVPHQLLLGRSPCECRPSTGTQTLPRPISLAWQPTLRPCSPPSPCGMVCVTPISSSHKHVDGLPWNHLTKGRI